MKKLQLFILSVLALMALPLANDSHAQTPQDVVIELFTSQGCPACPPAAKLLSQIADENDNITLLIWGVNYWDYLGWDDTMALEESSVRQKAYNLNLNQTGVYTPQVIINGMVQVIGSNEEKVRELIKGQAGNVMPLETSFMGNSDNLSINVAGIDATTADEAIISLIWFKEDDMVKIVSGDNSGSDFHYKNVVKGELDFNEIKPLANKNGNINLPLKLSSLKMAGADCLAILVQDKFAGKIIGFSKITIAEIEARS